MVFYVLVNSSSPYFINEHDENLKTNKKQKTKNQTNLNTEIYTERFHFLFFPLYLIPPL